MTGIPAQLRLAAGLNLKPARIAAQSEKFVGAFALPQVVKTMQADSPDDLTKARALVTAIQVELARMKRPRPGETDHEKAGREWRADRIDGIYALTAYWQQYEKITHRREVLVGGKPGSEKDTHSLRDGTEREIYEELTERLSRDPGQSDGLALLSEAEELLADSMSTKDMNPELQLMMLFRYAVNWEILNLARGIVARLIVEKERSGGYAPSNIGWILFEYLGPSFTEREFSALFAALDQPSKTLHPFLEYLEAHTTGRKVIDRWTDWLSTTDWDAIFRLFTFARVSLTTSAH